MPNKGFPYRRVARSKRSSEAATCRPMKVRAMGLIGFFQKKLAASAAARQGAMAA